MRHARFDYVDATPVRLGDIEYISEPIDAVRQSNELPVDTSLISSDNFGHHSRRAGDLRGATMLIRNVLTDPVGEDSGWSPLSPQPIGVVGCPIHEPGEAG
jgi:hypothetical protein